MRLPIRSAPVQASTLSARGIELAHAGSSMDKFKTIMSDPYHPIDNPDGFVNIGTAENVGFHMEYQLESIACCFVFVTDFSSKYLMVEEVAEFANKHIKFDSKDFTYGEGPWGTSRLRNAMAKYINRHFHPLRNVDADHLIFANGVTSLCEMLGLTLCNADDGILFSRPIYQAFKGDFGTTAKVQSVFVDFEGVDQFSPEAIVKYEQTLKKAQSEGVRIRALMLCHPHNPLGQCYPRETLIAFMQLCNKYKIHLLADEIYAMSVYDVADPKAVKFESVLSIETEKFTDSKYLHLLYGMSKDTGASGIRMGVIYTRNSELLRALSAISAFHWSGSANERVAILMLEDESWTDDFLRRSRERLAARNILVRHILDDEGIQYRKGANAGFFIWIDLRPFLSVSSHATLRERWKAEDELMERLIKHKVYITNGRDMSAEEPGWFRVIYSQDERVIREGLKRVMQVVKE